MGSQSPTWLSDSHLTPPHTMVELNSSYKLCLVTLIDVCSLWSRTTLDTWYICDPIYSSCNHTVGGNWGSMILKHLLSITHLVMGHLFLLQMQVFLALTTTLSPRYSKRTWKTIIVFSFDLEDALMLAWISCAGGGEEKVHFNKLQLN